ncbi:parvulin-like peptidyl-prolyl isomerase [Paenibacillus phyllosphaerae]|uniref:peptidylprolyl isomerase n=1 Tax=Paenibacillus phyllosphaerae TaxID=274593 RepID=A0A7W5FKY8_9BACL|nr:peptidylprolyl isomerase [Paenibacillus phyllosphaerae]MBB3108655.1 parvulin-like peptidyl-prolyl isomerase [Paenibacillus phyllosphaerae]
MTPLQTTALAIGGHAVTYRELFRQGLMAEQLTIIEHTIDNQLIGQWADELNVRATQEELMAELTKFRKGRQLFTAAKTNAWLLQHGMSVSDALELLRPVVLAAKLAETVITDETIERYFHEHLPSFEEVELSRLLVQEYGEAQELYFRLEEGEEFFRLARMFSLDEATRMAGGYAGISSRSELALEVAALLLGASAGEVAGPIETKAGYWLVRLEALYPAELTDEVRETIRQQLFRMELGERRDRTDLELMIWNGDED